MAVAGGTQALIATFAFGLVALASSGAACLFTFGCRQLTGDVAVSNGLRLVLLTFLLSSTLWSIMDFAATLISGDGNASCQVLIVFASGFDQIARLAFEQFLLGRIKPKKASSGMFILQTLISVRFIMGGVFVAVQRPQVDPICIAKNILVPLGIATLVTDTLIVCILLALILVIKPSIQSLNLSNFSLTPARTLTLVTAGFGAWLAVSLPTPTLSVKLTVLKTSIPMILGIEMLPIASRTVVPSIGLLVLIGLVVLFRSHLLVIETDPSLPSTSPNTSKALPSRPIESRDTEVSPEVFNRPWEGPQPHIAHAQRATPGAFAMPQSGSRGAERALPIIGRPTPGQTERGVGGVPVQGQLFPPTRTNTAPIVLQTPPKKRSKRKPAISNPVIRESSALKIRDKIPTIDLAMAAKNDQERRTISAKAVSLDRSSQRRTPTRHPSKNDVKRKAVSSASYMAALLPEGSRLAPDAATTATQVSPRAEDLRRRSPRPVIEVAMSLPAPSPRRPSDSAAQRSGELPPAIPPQSPLRRNRPGRSVLSDTSSIFMDPSVPPAIPTPLRQENTNWPSASAVSPLVPRVQPLPMPFPNPRSEAAPSKAYESAAAATARASVLTRSGPGSVRKDIRPSRQRPDSANAKGPAPAKTPVQLRAVVGIPLHPRAQRAKDLLDDAGGRGRTIMFSNKSDIDGVGQPISRQIVALSLANSSMSTDSMVHRPRPIPRKSSIYKADLTIKVSPTLYRHRLSRSGGSVELQRESMDSESDTVSRIPSFPEPPKSASAVLALRNYQKQSAVTPSSISESSGSRASVSAHSGPSNAAGTDPKTALSESTEFGSRTSTEPDSAYNFRRQSSPVLPAEEMRHVSMADPVPRFSDDYALASLPNSAISGTSSASQQDDDGKEIVPLILDTESEGSFSAHSSQRDSSAQPVTWHRRVGDACPTFSDRKISGTSLRRVLAPAPLLLGSASKPTRIVESQTPPPLESPQHALDIIQQQLRHLDESDSETGIEDKQRRMLLENLEAEMGAQETHWQDMRRNIANRSPSSTRSSMSLVLSGDLHLTSPQPSTALRSPDLGQTVIDKGADHASAPENHTKTPVDEKSEPPPSELTAGRSNSGFTDDGSAQAVPSGVENRAKFGKSASRNKDGLPTATITNDISAHRRLASHSSPPETDESEEDIEKEEDTEKEEEFDAASAKRNNFSAWTQPASVNLSAVEKAPLPVSHWSIDSDTTARASESLLRRENRTRDSDSPGGVSPFTREPERTPSPDRIYNKALVSPISSPAWLHQESQFSPAVSEQRQSPRRPVTQKPPRRSRRITLLPDIPESPKPLPYKRDTLGVFQFPWGETSDIPTLQPQRSSVFPVPHPGATLNEVPLAQPFPRSQGPASPYQTYPTSFFDHYSDDELPAPDSDGSTGGYSDDEDEAFDETTLWEIANLLRTSAIPSRNSLFPGSEDYRPPSRAGFVSADETTILSVRHLPTADLEDSTLGNTDKELPPLPLSDKAVWNSDTMYATLTRSAGLAQPDEKTWMHYLGKQAETLRAAPRKSEPATITSASLWSPTPKKAGSIHEPLTQGLWQSTKEVPASPASSTLSTPFLASPASLAESNITEMSVPAMATTESPGLWKRPAPVARVTFGLPQDDEQWGRYTAKKAQTSRPKPRSSAQDVIHSDRLWVSSKPAVAVAGPAPAPTAKIVPSFQPLWSKPAALPAEQTDGLWSASHIRHLYKTTVARPAALHTARKLRIDTRPLAALRSASLWSTTTQMPPRQVPDWLTLSTTLRPTSPDGASTLSDQDDASAFDTYSLRSEVTAASSVAASKQSKPVVPEAVPEEQQQEQQEKPEEEKLFFDVSRLHPVFAVDVLHVTSDNAHPAATGYMHSVVNGAPKPRRL
ncbi:hypothetical protein LLEC1_01771 [Akanthomyces lecanii]|uniref:Uncharacterized protein n=1 Tax=Cordyceps confragosa TaxID=2714763 RepID=A0A179I2S1_CORDF|nr:hypothetical protein LLEC1_01771 [Akanthomyces lecanii]